MVKRLWQKKTSRIIMVQGLLLLSLGLLLAVLIQNAYINIQSQNIATGFGFLTQQSGFEINQSLIDYSPTASYGRAIGVGIINTLTVAIIGIFLSLVIGTGVGIAKLSTNWLLAKMAAIYIEVFRNIPLLLQLFFWYALFTEVMPVARYALEPLPWLYLSNKGIQMPMPLFNDPYFITLGIGLLLSLILSIGLAIVGQVRHKKTGRRMPIGYITLALLLLAIVITSLIQGTTIPCELPKRTRFGFTGGMTLTPEFLAILLGLTLYTAAFIAEIVRSGITSIPKGQFEAAKALGLKPSLSMRLIILPQALPVMIPPLTSQMLNLTKNSSLAVAIGYPDLVNIAQTTMNQTGQAIEAVAILMTVYLSISLLTSILMNRYNRLIQRRYQ